MAIKCISVAQPFATFLILGIVRYEWRSWGPGYRGRLAIHASRNVSRAAGELCREEPFRSLLRAAGHSGWFDLPAGALLGTVRLVACRRAEQIGDLHEAEQIVAAFRPGRWAWELADPVRLPAPLPMSGRLGIYDLPELPPLTP